ncbi:ABC transporter permease [Streptomyces sp. NPDC026206]|uniref:ABC transporter permease n=1 Tax=Streptomyces sp. NPDC026206 TaxID=3157089 RepID=UPI0033FA24E7
MVTMTLAARFSPTRSAAVVRRNARAMQTGPSYWLLLLSGLIEPLLYLLSIGVGVGELIEGSISYRGHALEYVTFVAPAMLAVAAMSAAFSTTTFSFFAKLKEQRIYEAILATPVRPFEIATAEVVWATVRGAVYGGMFLAVMVALGTTGARWALIAFPATVLVVIAFAAIGMAASTLMRGWHDFDTLTTAQMALFLFSGTFSPAQEYPAAAQVVVEFTPLYHGVELLRRICLGDVFIWVNLWHMGYLLIVTAGCLWFATRRITTLLRD